jgi:hypothetical protein
MRRDPRVLRRAFCLGGDAGWMPLRQLKLVTHLGDGRLVGHTSFVMIIGAIRLGQRL